MNSKLRASLPALLALALAACGGDDHVDEAPHVHADVARATGGTFSDSATSASVTVKIPPNALSADATLHLEEVTNPPAAGPNQTAAGKAWRVELQARNGTAPVTLSQPIQLELAASTAPQHPTLGEVAVQDGSAWTRLSANFTRAPSTVLALTDRASGVYRVTLRTLRKSTDQAAVDRGFRVFMDETFGNEDFFTTLGLASLLNGVAPAAAVGLGVQVDLAKVPAGVASVMTGTDVAAKAAALQNPAVTVALVKAGAVVGVVDKSAPTDTTITRVGITCALCHQLVTPTTFQLAAGPTALPIGPLAVNGAPNLAMDAGAILSLTQGAQDAGLATTLAGWGPNLFDIRTAVQPNTALDDGVNNPTATPPLWNFVDLEAAGYPFGWDGLFVGPDALASQAEAVYHLVMNGKGAFGTARGALPPALRVAPPQRVLDKLPGAAVPAGQELVTAAKLRDLQEWMRSIVSPAPAAFDAAKAEAGWRTFHTAGCASCHKTPELSGDRAGPFVASPGATGDLAGGIRPPGLRGVRLMGPPYFHDGSVGSLEAAVAAMAQAVGGLSAADQANLVEYMKSL